MRKQFVKFLSLALAAAMLICTLAACGGGSGENVGNGQVNENVGQTEFHIL